jgi:hypothetical protein
MPSPISMKSSVITLKPEVEWLEEEIVLSVERLIEVNAKCRHLKKSTCKITLRQVFIKVYRMEIANFLRTFIYVGIFNPAV